MENTETIITKDGKKIDKIDRDSNEWFVLSAMFLSVFSGAYSLIYEISSSHFNVEWSSFIAAIVSIAIAIFAITSYQNKIKRG